MKNPYKSGLQFSSLAPEVLEEFLARQPWSVFRLPDWCRLQKPMKPLHVRIIVARRKAKKRAVSEQQVLAKEAKYIRDMAAIRIVPVDRSNESKYKLTRWKQP